MHLFSVNLPSLEEFLFGEIDEIAELRWDMLIWALSLNNITSDQLKELPKSHLVIVLALLFMVQVI